MFGTSGIRGTVGTDVTAELALDVGRALASEGYERVVVGRDVRPSGAVLADALMAGVRECGGTVLEVGIAPTPTIARAVSWTESDAGVVITASHNPATDNGIKLWNPSGRAFDPEQCETIATRLERGTFTLQPWDGHGSSEPVENALERHSRELCEAVSLDPSPSVVVDVGNGTGGITARVLADLGCDVVTLNGQQDGSFPGRPSEPTRETLGDLASFVELSDADLGIAHDGDADRMVAVDETGTFVPKDVLLALFARETATVGDVVAVPVDTSMAVDDALESVGAAATRTPVGDVFVADRAMDSDVVFGGEPSGAWIWPQETPCPDGPLAACKLLSLVADRGPLSTLVSAIETYPIRRQSIDVTDKTAVIGRVRDRCRQRYDDVDSMDGVYVAFEEGWMLVRASGTEPVVRITAEARTDSRANEIEAIAVDLLEAATSRE
ncbi:phosphoglucosamine mutase [Halobacteria archaeon AArc-curdl1]|uniref:Phosphoglucosamine mutase n=1 Tax=Natronosalvus hydrolyticus TaxID=2979988 RepID=A0AAP2Z865_9EURY|nr:phosphoglucosamine mutase [Halobacteria archaeon AArc-curdl1]